MALRLAATTTCLILVCTWGGTQYDWTSPQILLLSATTVAGAIAFVVAETRATSPVIPLALFKDRNFTLTTLTGLAVGVAMFGAIGYMPTYIQMVKGVDATQAGLLMTPMMGSLLVASIVSGQIVSRTGRYKLFPLVGMSIMAVGSAHVHPGGLGPTWKMCVFLSVFGIGIGLTMQILVLIVQNSVPNRIVGTATASSNFFRQVGATVGSAVVGSLFISRLKDLLAENLPPMPPPGLRLRGRQLLHAGDGARAAADDPGPGRPVLQRRAAAHLPGHDPAGRGGVPAAAVRGGEAPGHPRGPHRDRRDLHGAGKCHGVRCHGHH